MKRIGYKIEFHKMLLYISWKLYLYISMPNLHQLQAEIFHFLYFQATILSLHVADNSSYPQGPMSIFWRQSAHVISTGSLQECAVIVTFRAGSTPEAKRKYTQRTPL